MNYAPPQLRPMLSLLLSIGAHPPTNNKHIICPTSFVRQARRRWNTTIRSGRAKRTSERGASTVFLGPVSGRENERAQSLKLAVGIGRFCLLQGPNSELGSTSPHSSLVHRFRLPHTIANAHSSSRDTTQLQGDGFLSSLQADVYHQSSLHLHHGRTHDNGVQHNTDSTLGTRRASLLRSTFPPRTSSEWPLHEAPAIWLFGERGAEGFKHLWRGGRPTSRFGVPRCGSRRRPHHTPSESGAERMHRRRCWIRA